MRDFGREIVLVAAWIPAFAGMTALGTRSDSFTRLPWRSFQKRLLGVIFSIDRFHRIGCLLDSSARRIERKRSRMDETRERELELRLLEAELRIVKLERAIIGLSLSAARLSGIAMGHETDSQNAAQKAFDDAIEAAEFVRGKTDGS